MPVINETKNIIATLVVIKWCELGNLVINASDDGYNVLATSVPGAIKLFPSYATHPNTPMQYRDKNGQPVINKLTGRPLVSTAAGAYQVLSSTWNEYQARLKLPDFGKLSQDRIAVQLIRDRGAYALIQQGRFLQGLERCGTVWASLPASPYKQPTHSEAECMAVYLKSGGSTA